MHSKDFKIHEAGILATQPTPNSLDPTPQQVMGINPAVLKDLITDHLRHLRLINRSLPNSQGLDAALAALETEYYKIFGQRLIELKTAVSKQDKVAVLELRRIITALAKETDPDLSYRNIDLIMKKLSKQHSVTPESLHDAFVDIVGSTPDELANQLHSEQ